ncbi:smalltalk protein, partial [Bacteroides graminisolvens]
MKKISWGIILKIIIAVAS